MLLTQFLAGLQSLSPLPTSKCGLSVADSLVGGFVYILGPCRSFQWTLLWGWEFHLPPQSPQVFTTRGFETISPLRTLVCMVCPVPQLFFQLFTCKCGTACSTSHQLTYSGSPATVLPAQTSSHSLTMHPLHTGCLSPPLLPVWMNVSSSIPWLSDFHAVWFSGSSSYFLFLNLLLFFFWLCNESNCTYLCLHLGKKSEERYLFSKDLNWKDIVWSCHWTLYKERLTLSKVITKQSRSERKGTESRWFPLISGPAVLEALSVDIRSVIQHIPFCA